MVTILTNTDENVILNKGVDDEGQTDKPAHNNGVQRAYSTGIGTEGSQVPQRVQAAGIQAPEKERRVEGILPNEGRGSERLRPEVNPERRVGDTSLEQSHSPGDTGER